MSALKLDPGLDPAAAKPLFARFGRLHLPALLATPDAQRLAEALKRAPWSRTFLADGKGYDVPRADYAVTPEEVRREVEAAIARGGRTGFQFDFDTWRISDFLEAGQRQGGAVAELEAAYDLLNSPAFLDFVRKLTGDERPAYCDAQATRYRAGQFLTAHDDELAGKDRLYAYVLNLTPGWRVEWGGLLLFHDADGHVAEAYAPKFNTLNIFRVPQWHSVSQVASYVDQDRLAITGWIRGSKPG
ncbi:2OG-Fe(II) oxygenase [Phenylobacterium sp.]|uniref:2OG-Fe(II) oxygenase n=1 Tax=Phenylobacterium sp. TaxID=1871053 RepID=UPI002DF455B9|nr:2OG-Fe(II) oxygenase family protein [Phenylobacterium sp.]